MMREILDACLTKRQRGAGFHLEEDSDDFLLLKQGEIIRACFPQTKATIVDIQEEADKWVKG